MDRLAPTATALALALVALLPATDAGAVIRYDQFRPSDRCQPALPAYAQGLRVRPLATVNEGTTDAFVTCGYGGKLWGTRSRTDVLMRLHNFGPTEVTTTCTLVDEHTDIVYLVKTRIVSPGTQTAFDFFDDDNDDVRFNMPSVSCRLPPGVGVITMGEAYEDDPTP